MELSNKLNNASFPLKRYLAKAKPAIELKNKGDELLPEIDRKILLKKYRPIFKRSKKLFKLVKMSDERRPQNAVDTPMPLHRP